MAEGSGFTGLRGGWWVYCICKTNWFDEGAWSGGVMGWGRGAPKSARKEFGASVESEFEVNYGGLLLRTAPNRSLTSSSSLLLLTRTAACGEGAYSAPKTNGVHGSGLGGLGHLEWWSDGVLGKGDYKQVLACPCCTPPAPRISTRSHFCKRCCWRATPRWPRHSLPTHAPTPSIL